MRRFTMLFVVAVLTASAASAGIKPSITPSSIAGAKLDLKASAYKKRFGKPVRKDVLRFPTNWTRLVFTKRRIGVYLNVNGRAVVVTTWNKRDKTAEGIGPCSSIEEAKATYGSKFKPTESGTLNDHDSDPTNDLTFTYVVGKIMFAATGRDHPSDHVTAVAFYRGPQNMANFLATQLETSALRCS
jgi:hypothetical protein